MRWWYPNPYSAPSFFLDHGAGDHRVVTLRIPGYEQARSYSCGYASALMIVRYFDPVSSAVALYEQLGTSESGTAQTAIVRALRATGLRVGIRYDMDFARLARCIDRGKPIIGYLSDVDHWLVVYGYGRSPDRVFVADPRPGLGCAHHWQEYGPRLGSFGMICSDRSTSAAGQLSLGMERRCSQRTDM